MTTTPGPTIPGPTASGPALRTPSALLRRDEFAQACRTRDFAVVFACLRRYGLSQVRIAAALEMSTSRVGEIIRGRRRISTIEVIERVSDRLGIPGHLLGLAARPWESDPDEPAGEPAPAVPAADGIDVPWTAEGALTAAQEVTMEAHTRRRFLFMGGAALTAPAYEWLIAAPVASAAAGGHRAVSGEMLHGVELAVSRIRHLDDEVGGGAVLPIVRRQTRHVITLLRDGRYPDSVGRRLYGAAAELLRLNGWAHLDSGRHAEAQRYFVAALRTTHAAGDRALGANILHFMGGQAATLAKPREALALAESAQSGYSGESPKVRTLLALTAARAHASASDHRAFERALDDAHDALGHMPPSHGDPEWSYWVDEAQIGEHAGYGYLALKDWSSAAEHLVEALRVQEPATAREGALRRAMLATAYAAQGEIERACQVADEAADLLTDHVDSARSVAYLLGLNRRLAPHQRLPAVRGTRERIRELAAHH